MAWDKDTPAGNTKVSLGDDAIRTNNAAIETAVDEEHYFATGGTQDGVHKFGTGDTTAESALTVRDGRIYFRDDIRTGTQVLRFADGGAWESVDVEPLDGSGNATLPRLNARSLFTVTQWSELKSVTPSPGTPDLLTVDCLESPSKYATIVGDTKIVNPTNVIAGYTTTIELELTMSGAGHVISLDTSYRTPNNNAGLIYDDADGAVNIFYLKRLSNSYWFVTCSPGVYV